MKKAHQERSQKKFRDMLRVKRLLVCGSRYWTNQSLISMCIRFYNPEIVIHGNARGADSIAGEEAKKLGIEVKAFPANWDLYGRAAGAIRNQQMIDEGQPDFILAFHDFIEISKGTKDMLKLARRHNIPWELVESNEDCRGP